MLIHGIKSLRISGTEGAQPSSTVKTTPEEEAYPFPIPSPDGQGFLGDGAEEGFENTPVSSNPLHAFTFGETTRSAEEIQEADVSKRLNLPSFEELALGREGAPYFLTTIEKKYQGAIETLLKAETSYKESLQVHGLRSHEARAIQDKLRLVEKALDQARGELDKVHAAIERQNKTYQEELSRGIDLNGDGKVGGGPDAIGVAQDENGMTVYVDPATGKPLGKPAAFPEYKPQLVRGNGLLKIDEPIDRTSEYYRNNGQFNDQAPDLFFKVNGQFSGSGNLLESQGTIAIPEAMWVKKGPDHRPEIDVNKGGYVLFNEWDTASGITQAPPANAKDAMLVTINRMNVYSEEASTKANLGNDAAGHPILKPLYHQIIELYSNSPEGEFLVARIRIEGDFTAQAGHPPAAAPITPTDGHSGYIAASTIPLIFTGDPDANGEGGRWNPLITDLSHMESTGRAVFNDLEEKMGISAENLTTETAQQTRALQAYEQNIHLFKKGADAHRYRIIESTGQTQTDIVDQSTFNSIYIPDTDLPENDAASDTLDIRTGAVLYHLRGDHTLSGFNDIAVVSDPNAELHANIKSHMPANLAPLQKGDPFYATVVRGGGGHNIVIAKNGDIMAENATFFWGDLENGDEAIITTPGTQAVGADKWKNPRNFVKVNGGTAYVHNELEKVASEQQNSGLEHTGLLRTDDFYEIGRGGAYANTQPDTGSDVWQSGMGELPFNEYFTDERKNTFRTKIRDAIEKIPEVTLSEEAVTDWKNNYGTGHFEEMKAEVDSFFDEKLGGLNEVLGEAKAPTE